MMLNSSGCFASLIGYDGNSNTPLELISNPQPVLHNTQLTPEEWAWLRRKETLVLGTFGPDHPPFRLGAEQGEMTGIISDYTTILGRELGVKIRVRLYNSIEQAAKALHEGQVDMITAWGPTSKLKIDDESYLKLFRHDLASDIFLHTDPVIVRPTSEQWAPLDITGLKVAFNSSEMSLTNAQQIAPSVQMVPFSSSMEAFSAVAFGSLDALLSDSISAYFTVNTYYANELQVTKTLWGQVPSGLWYIIEGKNTRLLRIINSVINTGVSIEQQDNILRRWSGGGLIRPERPKLDAQLTNWVKNHPKIRVGVSNNYPPQSYFGGDGRYYGLTADLLSWIQAQTGLDVEVSRFANIDDVFSALDDGTIDMVADVAATHLRRQRMLFSHPYVTMPYALVMGADSPPRFSLSELHGKTLIMPSGHAMVTTIKEDYPNINLIEARDVVASLDGVKEGRADATILPLLIARYYIARFYEPNLRINMTLSDPLSTSSFAMRRDNPELANTINSVLAQISPYELSSMINRWRSQVVLSPPSWHNYGPLIYNFITVSLFFLLCFFGWNVYLRQQVKQRKQAELDLNKQIQFMTVLINGMPHPIYVCDSKLNLQHCNNSYLDAIGLNPDDMGIIINQPVLLDVLDIALDHQWVVENNEQKILDRTLSLKGEEQMVYHWMLPYEDLKEEGYGVIGGWLDITERRVLLEQLKLAKELADQASRAKTTFLAIMSHEIRTPLNAVIGMLELVLQRNTSPPPERDSLVVAHQSARELLELIGDILDVARIESGRLTLNSERASLKKIAEGVIRVFDGLARQKSLELKLEISCELKSDVLIDPLRFRQVLSNLVSNAIKFTEQGQVMVSLNATSVIEDYVVVRVAVSDTGVGISPEGQQRLFEPFAQANDCAEGSGLGLMICRSLVSMMGGELTLESQLDKGTMVMFELKLLLLEPVPPRDVVTDTSGEEQTLPCFNILVVDDHPANRLLLTQQLIYLGQRVESAIDGANALVQWRRRTFDLVITDCNMPIMNGYSLALNIRNEEALREAFPCLILGLTANAQQEERQRCLDAGMNECLFKPIELVNLTNIIAEMALKIKPLQKATFDISGVRKIAGDNPALVATFLTQIKESTREDMTKLGRLLEVPDLTQFDSLAHRIKGAAKIVKASRLYECSERLEEACRGQDTELPLAIARELMTVMEELLETIELCHHEDKV